LLRIDASDRGQTAALACAAAMPNLETKKQLLAQVIDPKSPLSADKQKAIIYALTNESQESFLLDLSGELKAYIKENLARRDEDFQGDFADGLAPVGCTAESVADFRNFMASAKLSDVTRRSFKIILQERELCVTLRRRGGALFRAQN
jgi:hypothetical protein